MSVTTTTVLMTLRASLLAVAFAALATLGGCDWDEQLADRCSASNTTCHCDAGVCCILQGAACTPGQCCSGLTCDPVSAKCVTQFSRELPEDAPPPADAGVAEP